MGRNGAGKTTAMRIALGVLEADSGEVRWHDRAGRGLAHGPDLTARWFSRPRSGAAVLP